MISNISFESGVDWSVLEKHDFLGSSVRKVLKLYSKLSKDPRGLVTTVEELVKSLGLTRKEAVRALRVFEEARCGSFTMGRRGRESRFDWSISPLEISKTFFDRSGSELYGVGGRSVSIRGENDSNIPYGFMRTGVGLRTRNRSYDWVGTALHGQNNDSDSDEGLTYSFPVRRGVNVIVRVPSDMTEKEAVRLSKLIATLGLPE